MPTPLITSFIGGLASNTASNVITSPGMWSAAYPGSLLDGDWKRQISALRSPIVPPGPEALVNAIVKGWAAYDKNGKYDHETAQALTRMLRYQGVAVGEGGYNKESPINYLPYKDAWDTVIQSQYVKPGIAEALRAYVAGGIKKDEFERMLRRNGALIKDWEWMIPYLCQRLTLEQYLELYKRGTINEQDLTDRAKHLQYLYDSDIEGIKELSNVIPGYGDVVRFAIREAFNPAQVTALGLDAELKDNPDYLTVAKAAGLGKVKIAGLFDGSESIDMAKLYWYAHWDLPSPTMAYGFYHRYYKDKKYGDSPFLKHGAEFTYKDLENLLKASDYAPKWRRQLAGLSYHPYTRIDVRRLRLADVIKEPAVYHNYRASGYDEEHALALTEWTELEVKKSKTGKSRLAIKAKACEAYKTGLIDIDEHRRALEKVGFSEDEAKIEGELCNMDLASLTAKDGIASVRNGFLSGLSTKQEATGLLADLGIKKLASTRYLTVWQLRLDSFRKVIAAKEISQWFVDGIIAMPEFNSRLTKLHYTPADITRIIQAAVLEQAKRLRQAQKRAAKEMQGQFEKNIADAEKRRRERDKLLRNEKERIDTTIKNAKTEHARRLQKFLSARSESNLKAWFAAGEIKEDEIRGTLRLKGWAMSDIDRFINMAVKEE